MKLVVAMIQPQQLPAVKLALQEAKFANLTCTNVIGSVPNREEHLRFRGVDQEITLFQKVRVEIAVELPPGFPAKYRAAVVRAAEACSVKKHLATPPEIRISAIAADAVV